MGSVGGNKEFYWLFFLFFFFYYILSTPIIFILFPPFSYIFSPDRALGIPTSACDESDTLRIFPPFKQTPFSFVCMYLCKYRGGYRGVRRSRMGGFFFLPFSLESCLHFFCHWVGAFSFFIQTGFYGVLHIKHIFSFFPHHIFIFAFPRQNIYLISRLFFSLLLFFDWPVGSFSRGGKEEQKERCDGWTEGEGEDGEIMEVSLFSLVG